MLLEVWIAAVISIFSVLAGGQFIAPILAQIGFVAQDINKRRRPIIPASGGIILIFGVFLGVIALIFSLNYFISAQINTEALLIALVSVIAISFIGFLDDMMGNRIRTSKEDTKKMAKNYIFFNGGIKQWQKPLLTLIAAIPLMAINWGAPVINLPFIGGIQLNQLLYAFVIVPLAVVFSANVFNMLEGLNGICSQMGLVVFIALAIFAYHTGAYTAFALASIFAGSLIGYAFYGSYPAKVLPGDSLTYMVGSGFAATVIIGNMQVLGILLLIPWIAEFFLKARARFHASSWGLIKKDGRLGCAYKKVYSMTHIFLRTGRYREWEIVAMLTAMEAVIAAISLILVW